MQVERRSRLKTSSRGKKKRVHTGKGSGAGSPEAEWDAGGASSGGRTSDQEAGARYPLMTLFFLPGPSPHPDLSVSDPQAPPFLAGLPGPSPSILLTGKMPRLDLQGCPHEPSSCRGPHTRQTCVTQRPPGSPQRCPSSSCPRLGNSAVTTLHCP